MQNKSLNKKAIILAAGMGNRISSVNKNIPKPLLPLNGVEGSLCFLDWHIRFLYEAGVRDIFLVGNQRTYQTPLQVPAEILSEINLKWILNPTEDLSTSGSGHSFWFADQSPHSILDSNSQVFLMDADIFYTKNIFQYLLNSPKSGSKTLIAPRFNETSEEVLVFSKEPQKPYLHGKGLYSLCKKVGLECLGEASGVLLWEPVDHALLKECIQWTMSFSTAKKRSEHEDITQRMMSFGKCESVFIPEDCFFMEVDTPEEYETLIKFQKSLS